MWTADEWACRRESDLAGAQVNVPGQLCRCKQKLTLQDTFNPTTVSVTMKFAFTSNLF